MIVIVNRSPRVSRTRGSAWLTAAICRSRTPARSSPAVIVERSAWCPRCHARCTRPSRSTSASILAFSRISGSPDAIALSSAKPITSSPTSSISRTSKRPRISWLMNRALRSTRLPHVGIERAFGDVPVYSDVRVLVCLALDSAVALGDVSRPPRNVEMVQGDRPRLDVGADPHLLRRAEDHVHVPGAAGREQAGLLDVVACLVDVADPVGGDAAVGELVAELVVGVPPLPPVWRGRRTRSAARPVSMTAGR